MGKPKPPKLVTLAVTTTITVIFWIFFVLYRTLTAVVPPSVDPGLLEPISPVLNVNNLSKIGDRVFFEEGSFSFKINTSVTPTPSPKPTSTPELTPTIERSVPTEQ